MSGVIVLVLLVLPLSLFVKYADGVIFPAVLAIFWLVAVCWFVWTPNLSYCPFLYKVFTFSPWRIKRSIGIELRLKRNSINFVITIKKKTKYNCPHLPKAMTNDVSFAMCDIQIICDFPCHWNVPLIISFEDFQTPAV